MLEQEGKYPGSLIHLHIIAFTACGLSNTTHKHVSLHGTSLIEEKQCYLRHYTKMQQNTSQRTRYNIVNMIYCLNNKTGYKALLITYGRFQTKDMNHRYDVTPLLNSTAN